MAQTNSNVTAKQEAAPSAQQTAPASKVAVSEHVRTARAALFDEPIGPPAFFNALDPPSAIPVCIGRPLLTTLPPRFWNELPIDRSDSVVTGQVINSQSFLSASKSVEYTEFDVRVTEVAKGAARSRKSRARPKEVVTVLRRGGRFSQEDGAVIDQPDRARYAVEVGKEYLFFLVYHQPSDASCIEAIFRIEEGLLTSARPVEQGDENTWKSKVAGRPVAEVLSELKEENSRGPRRFRSKQF